MSSNFKNLNYNQQFLIVNLVILLSENHFSQHKRYRTSIIFVILLIKNIDDCKIIKIDLKSACFLKIIMNQKKRKHKNISKITKN